MVEMGCCQMMIGQVSAMVGKISLVVVVVLTSWSWFTVGAGVG